MVPTREEALEALREAESMNPGQWVDHVKNICIGCGGDRILLSRDGCR